MSLLPFTYSETCMPTIILKSLSCHSIPSSYPNYNTSSSSKHSEYSDFLLPLRSTRIVSLSLKRFSSELETEAKITLTLLIKLTIGETDVGEHRPGWMRGAARVFIFLISAFKRLVISRPTLIDVPVNMRGVDAPASDSIAPS